MQFQFSNNRLYWSAVCGWLLGSLVCSSLIAQSSPTGGSRGGTTGVASESRSDNSGSSSLSPRDEDSSLIANTSSRSWQTYDISGYTSAVKSVPDPEKNVLNWILRETGTDTWFAEPEAVLSVGRHRVRCYHDAETQRTVRAVIDRFTRTEKQDEVFGFQVVTIGNPNWRAKLLPLLKPIDVETPGAEAWVASKENAAQFFSELRKRNDFLLPISHSLVTESGQPKKIIHQTPLPYFRSITLDGSRFPPFRVESAVINEGYQIGFSSLRTLDGKKMDAEIDCRIAQVEQFRNVNLDVPGPGGMIQKHPISIPQMSMARLKERFQWPADEVLVISLGVVPAPDRKFKPNPTLQDVLEPRSRVYANVLLMIDCKGLFPRGQAPKSAYRLVPLRNRR